MGLKLPRGRPEAANITCVVPVYVYPPNRINQASHPLSCGTGALHTECVAWTQANTYSLHERDATSLSHPRLSTLPPAVHVLHVLAR